VNVWFSMCMNYYCGADSSEDREAVKCFYTEAYARECTSVGVIVQWRHLAVCRELLNIAVMLDSSLLYVVCNIRQFSKKATCI